MRKVQNRFKNRKQKRQSIGGFKRALLSVHKVFLGFKVRRALKNMRKDNDIK